MKTMPTRALIETDIQTAFRSGVKDLLVNRVLTHDPYEMPRIDQEQGQRTPLVEVIDPDRRGHHHCPETDRHHSHSPHTRVGAGEKMAEHPDHEKLAE